MSAVYASEKLKSWGERQREKGGLAEEDVPVRLGYFTGVDGELHWGVEIAKDDVVPLEKLIRGNTYAQ